MKPSTWIEWFGKTILAVREDPIDARARRWLWLGWGVSALLGFLMPLYHGTIHVSGEVVLGAAVLVMVAVDTATRRPLVGLTMSISGIVTGSAFGFGLLAALTHRPLFWAITAQMGFGGLFLGRLFVRELRPRSEPPEDPFWEEIRHLPKEEAQALVIARLKALTSEAQILNDSLNRMQKSNNAMLVGGAVALMGGAIVFAGRWSSSPETWARVALAPAAFGASIVFAGAYYNWAVRRTQPPPNRLDETQS